jgi:hypothetical protein
MLSMPDVIEGKKLLNPKLGPRWRSSDGVEAIILLDLRKVTQSSS